MTRNFKLSDLPVAFGQDIPRDSETGTLNFRPYMNAIKQLEQYMKDASGNSFRQLRTTTSGNNREVKYCCVQDQFYAYKRRSDRKRDRGVMERFPCDSKLVFRPRVQNQELLIQFQHSNHVSYADNKVPHEVENFITSRSLQRTPGEIYRELQLENLPEADVVAQHQIYHLWRKANQELWRRHEDAITSANILLHESASHVESKIYTVGNLTGLASYINESVSALAGSAKELVIDSTYGTNNAGLELFAILAELDGTGIPLGYLFLKHDQSSLSSDPGARCQVLILFLQYLKHAGLNPVFFGCDKEKSEISAIQHVWAGTTIQLCFWHCKRSIRQKMQASKKTKTQDHYHPHLAQALIPCLEICWGAQDTRKPLHTDH